MNLKLYILMAPVAVATLTSCESDTEYESNFLKSQYAWLAFKEAANNSYSYTVTDESHMAGIAWETKIYVWRGHVMVRTFKFTRTEGLPENFPEEDLEWTEYEDELNTHLSTPAVDAITLDKVYQKAKNDWLQERDNTKTYFEAENDGLISLCGYVPKGCQDDCFRGIRIESIDALN